MSEAQAGVAIAPGPCISVIVPTYNRANFIGDAIASVLSQSFSDFEVIVVDDGSTDQTGAIVAGFDDPRVIYVHQSNRGRSSARNHALSLARGRYLAFLDSDDMYMPGKLMLQVDYMDAHPDVGMIYTSAHCVDYSGNPLNENYIASVSGRIYKSIAFFRPVTITLPTVMARRELFEKVGGFDEKMHRFEDTDMWRRISKVTRIDALPVFTCRLRTHAENSLIAQDPVQLVAALEYYVDKIMVEDTSVSMLTRKRGIGHLYDYYGRAFLTVPEWKDAGWRLIKTAYQYWPLLWAHQILIAVHYRLKSIRGRLS
ncbi:MULTISPECIES: glycosyltransferase family 2 protein [Polaromonas]|uniref:Glycosyltransferase family 2 protein n=1 Tax=Polaromonas aquatica TaxID=332657 RepID=A0ABW1TZX6_9BURK